jgi:flavin-dependent dehydrogenase
MPVADPSQAWGHAVGREHLDPALLDAAVAAGASAWQPWSARQLRDEGGAWRVDIADRHGAHRALHARIVVAAHGSWEPGNLATQLPRAPRRASDLLGFKARFDGAALDADLMPLVLFPGGYGGLVRSDAGAVSFSCCIRRDALGRCRARRPGLAAGDAVLAHASASCRALREALGTARPVAPWLSAGPIRPGIRPQARARLFATGNAAGEAHPLVAEGISMAIQASWLLAEALAAEGSLGDAAVQAAGRRYEREWQRHFAPRIRASQVFAALTTAPATSAASIAALAAMPRILTLGAAWSGKARALRAAQASP